MNEIKETIGERVRMEREQWAVVHRNRTETALMSSSEIDFMTPPPNPANRLD